MSRFSFYGFLLGTLTSFITLTGSETLAFVKPGEKTSLDLKADQCEPLGRESYKRCQDRCTEYPAGFISCAKTCAESYCPVNAKKMTENYNQPLLRGPF